MRVARRLAIGSVLAALAGCSGQIPVVGFDAEGKIIETMMPHDKYVSQMSRGVSDMTESVIPVAETESQKIALSGLRGIRLGLGLKGSVGLGDYWKLGGNIGFNLHFANK